MAKGKQQHQARKDEISLLGKDLARRASRRCELCEDNDDPRPYDTATDEEPSLSTLVLLCARCRAVADGRQDDPATLRFLENAIWSDNQALGGTARAMLRRVDAPWARNALELIT